MVSIVLLGTIATLYGPQLASRGGPEALVHDTAHLQRAEILTRHLIPGAPGGVQKIIFFIVFNRVLAPGTLGTEFLVKNY